MEGEIGETGGRGDGTRKEEGREEGREGRQRNLGEGSEW